MILIRVGDREGFMPKTLAARALQALESAGVTIEPTPRNAVRATTSKTMTSRVAIRDAKSADFQALEAAASQKSMDFRRRLLAGGLTVSEARTQLGVGSNQTIHNWIKTKKLLALPDRHRKLIPPWQFDPRTEDGIIRGLSAVLQLLNANPFGIASWLTTPNAHLRNATPLELLRRGKAREVAEEARGVRLSQ